MDPDPVDQRDELPRVPLRLTSKEVMILAASTMIGLLVGVVMGLAGSDRIVATALVDAGPGGSTESALDVSPDVANRYVQTELIYIGILQPEFEKAFASAGIANPGSIDARQDGPTSIVQLSAEAQSDTAAAEQANIAAEVYIEDWRSRATADLQRLQENTQLRIDEVQKQLDALGNSPDDRARAVGLRSELQRLTQELSDLQYREGGIRVANRMVQEATPGQAVARTSVPIYTALGLVLGVAIGLALIVYRRVVTSAAPDHDAVESAEAP